MEQQQKILDDAVREFAEEKAADNGEYIAQRAFTVLWTLSGDDGEMTEKTVVHTSTLIPDETAQTMLRDASVILSADSCCSCCELPLDEDEE